MYSIVMFNLFPKKKSVDKIIEDANLAPFWQWTPTQTPSMLQAQNELIEQFLKENHDLKIKNQKLKAELDKWEKDWDEQNKNVSELTKEMLQLRHLKEENVQLMERVNEIDNDVIRDLQDEILVLKNDYAVLKARYQSLNEKSDEVKKSQNWSTLKVTMEDAIHQAKWRELTKTFPNEFQEEPDFLSCACGDCYEKTKQYNKFQDAYTECVVTGHKIPKEKSWEEAASDLALRVAKLEENIILSNNEQKDNNPLYKHY